MDSKDDLLEVRGLTVKFGRFTALDHVSYDLKRGETLGIVGESGSGKTTSARVVCGLQKATSGRFELAGRVAMIFQDPLGSLNPRQTIRAALAEVIRHVRRSGTRSLSLAPCPRTRQTDESTDVPCPRTRQTAESTDAPCPRTRQTDDSPATVQPPTSNLQPVEERIRELLSEVGLDESCLDKYPHEFSGGQRQRICIAKALALEPELLICDEAVSALDLSVRATVLDLLAELKKRLSLTMLFITHDLGVVSHIADRVLVMSKGKIIEEGPCGQVLKAPREEYTKRLIASVLRLT